MSFGKWLLTEKARRGLLPAGARVSDADSQRGLYGKYHVTKASDGTSVRDCFVLRPDKDPAAKKALRYYAQITEDRKLADEMVEWMYRLPRRWKGES